MHQPSHGVHAARTSWQLAHVQQDLIDGHQRRVGCEDQDGGEQVLPRPAHARGCGWVTNGLVVQLSVTYQSMKQFLCLKQEHRFATRSVSAGPAFGPLSPKTVGYTCC